MATTPQGAPTPTAWQGIFRSLSTGAKLMVIGMLALFMSIAALFLDKLVDERTGRKADTLKEISAHVGGPQTFLGPTLLVPYTLTVMARQEPTQDSKASTTSTATVIKRGVYVVFPTNASASLNVKTEEKRRAMFRVPVFHAEQEMQASFDLTGVPNALPTDAVMEWNKAELVVGVSDVRGALADAVLTTASGATAQMTPATTLSRLSYGQGDSTQLTLLGTGMHEASPGAKFDVSAKLHFSGAQRIAVLPYGKTTQVDMRADWPNPSFNGGLLPITHEVNDKGFHAVWSVPFIARSVTAQGDSEHMTGLEPMELGVSFAEPADPYQSMTRSVKYAPLFLGLVFLTYFLFEVTTGKRLHIAQYLLVGLAQIIFYLLLLSFAEHTGFDIGFLIAGAASVALLATNVGWVFASRLQAMRAAGIFGALYGMIYMLLRLEDNALMVGAIGSFAAVAAAMYFTRSIDWYGTGTTSMRTAAAGGSPLDRVGEL